MDDLIWKPNLAACLELHRGWKTKSSLNSEEDNLLICSPIAVKIFSSKLVNTDYFTWPTQLELAHSFPSNSPRNLWVWEISSSKNSASNMRQTRIMWFFQYTERQKFRHDKITLIYTNCIIAYYRTTFWDHRILSVYWKNEYLADDQRRGKFCLCSKGRKSRWWSAAR